MMDDGIISALIGLAGACGNNPKTENTDALIVRALTLSQDGATDGKPAVQEMIGEIHAEKNAVAPGCAICAAPCGNTSDYDMERLYRAPEEVRELKLQILSEVRRLAEGLRRENTWTGDRKTDPELISKALTYVGCDLEAETLNKLLAELKARQ